MKKLVLFPLGLSLLALMVSAAPLEQERSSNKGPVTGSWDCFSHGGPRGDTKFTLDLEQDGEKITGSVDSAEGGMDITSGTFKNDTLEVRLETPEGNYVLTAKLKDGQLTGSITMDDKQQGTWEGKKAAASENK